MQVDAVNCYVGIFEALAERGAGWDPGHFLAVERIWRAKARSGSISSPKSDVRSMSTSLGGGLIATPS